MFEQTDVRDELSDKCVSVAAEDEGGVPVCSTIAGASEAGRSGGGSVTQRVTRAMYAGCNQAASVSARFGVAAHQRLVAH